LALTTNGVLKKSVNEEIKLKAVQASIKAVFDELMTSAEGKDAVFYRKYPFLNHKFGNMVIFGQETYIHFVALETSIIRT